MPFQVDLSFAYNPDNPPHEKWTGFVKFDAPIQTESGAVVQCVMTNGMTFSETAFRLLRSDALIQYVNLGQDDSDGAKQAAEGLVN